MKKKTVTISLVALTCFTAVAATSASIAWFTKTTYLTPTSFFGKTDGAYFAYGDGTALHPYGLNAPRHLYNLAWLNMMGYFKNKDVYFEIDPDVEGGVLNGLDDQNKPTVIPPIGTVDYPFTGSFNGNGKVISNFVISANFNDYKQKPYNASTIFTSAPEIVGLFGVIGTIPTSTNTYTYSGSADQLYNVGITNLTIKTATTNSLVGIVAGYVNGPISNVAVNESSIDVSTSTTGAVDGDDFTPNLSDYGIIGYCTNNYSTVANPTPDTDCKKDITKNKATIYQVSTISVDEFNAHEKGEDTGSGASIDMKDMYTKLDTNWKMFNSSNTNRNTYRAKYRSGTKEITINKNGSTTVNNEGTMINTYSYYNTAENRGYNGTANASNNSPIHTYYNYAQSSGGNQTASYTYIIEYNGNNHGVSGSEENYMCLGGKVDDSNDSNLKRVYNGTTSQTYSLKTNSYELTNGYYVKYNENYLTRGATGFNATSSGSASLWTYTNNKFMTSDANNDDLVYYLNCDANGALSITTTDSTTWNRNNTRGYYATVSGTDYYLGFNGSQWTTTVYNANDFYYIHSGNNYLTHNGTANLNPCTNTTSTTQPSNNKTKWFLDSNNRFRTTNGGSYYLSYNSNVRVYNYNSYAMTYTGTTNTGDNTGTIRRDTRYLRYNNGWTTANNTEYTITATKVAAGFQVDIHSASISYTSSGSTFYRKVSSTTTKNAGLITNDTYFPLKSTISGSSLSVDDANTGYVVSGANYRTSTDPYGDIRVSRFDMDQLSGSYDEDEQEFTNIYTINGSGTHSVDIGTGEIGDTEVKFERFINSSAQMLNTLTTDSSYIYGLHFMNAQISPNKLIKAPWAKVLDKDPHELADGEEPYSTYTNFEMPQDSIDFHFKENGYINFFAGTYYSGAAGDNDTFFSLHQIERYKSGDTEIPPGKSVNDIKSIKEIQNIYENTQTSTKVQYPYVYKYKDNSYSTGEAGTLLFNTDWITNPSSITMNSAYYFEIPANKGEYALGSVSGKSGSYLMYLDLGANANKIARTQVSEHFFTLEEKYDYPVGVAFVSSITTNSSGVIAVDPLDSVNFVVQPGYTGSVTLNRSSATTATATISNTAQKAKVSAGYYKDTIAFTDGTSPLKTLPKERIEAEHKRVQLLDYGINFLILTRTVVEQTVTTRQLWGVTQNEVTSTTMKQYSYNADGSLNASKTYTSSADESKIVVYNPADTSVPGQPYTDPKTQVFALYNNQNTTSYVLSFLTNSGTTVEYKFDLVYSFESNSSYYYQIDGYNITIRVVGEDVVVTITNGLTSYTFKINSTAANSGTVDVTAGAQITDP